MSGVAKGVKKVFKKVAKVVKKVAPVVLAAAAIYFTAGAALGVAGAAGGWGAAASSLASSMGATGTLGTVLTGALTQAGYGAAVGGAISGLTGGSVKKGMQMGAATGAATGGLMSGMNVASQAGRAGSGIKVTELPPPSGAAQPTGGPFPQPEPATAAASAPGATTAGSTAPASGGGLFSQGGWLERNQMLAGGAIGGLGQGISAAAAAGDERDAIKERYKRIAGNYALPGDEVPGHRSLEPVEGGAREPARPPRDRWQRFAGEYVYDPQQGRVVFRPAQGGG